MIQNFDNIKPIIAKTFSVPAAVSCTRLFIRFSNIFISLTAVKYRQKKSFLLNAHNEVDGAPYDIENL